MDKETLIKKYEKIIEDAESKIDRLDAETYKAELNDGFYGNPQELRHESVLLGYDIKGYKAILKDLKREMSKVRIVLTYNIDEIVKMYNFKTFEEWKTDRRLIDITLTETYLETEYLKRMQKAINEDRNCEIYF